MADHVSAELRLYSRPRCRFLTLGGCDVGRIERMPTGKLHLRRGWKGEAWCGHGIRGIRARELVTDIGSCTCNVCLKAFARHLAAAGDIDGATAAARRHSSYCRHSWSERQDDVWCVRCGAKLRDDRHVDPPRAGPHPKTGHSHGCECKSCA